jgi:hypothetical protein
VALALGKVEQAAQRAADSNDRLSQALSGSKTMCFVLTRRC